MTAPTPPSDVTWKELVAEIRPYNPADLEDLYRICLATGSAGSDASHLYRDPKLVGHIYAAPYGCLCPETAMVVEDAEGVGGYILGVLDTLGFEERLESEWWPRLRAIYPDPLSIQPADWTSDEHACHTIHHPPRTPRQIAEPYPAHLHIDLVPRLQGRGIGRRLMDSWLALIQSMGARGAHLAVGVFNKRAERFYRAYGLKELANPDSGAPTVTWFGANLADRQT
jgi:ribosomal protein S18 acetylase RimI-like enzyme